jgi:hypothetical protein
LVAALGHSSTYKSTTRSPLLVSSMTLISSFNQNGVMTIPALAHKQRWAY